EVRVPRLRTRRNPAEPCGTEPVELNPVEPCRTPRNPVEPRADCYTSIMRSAGVLIMICSLVLAARGQAQGQRRRPATRKPPPPPPLQTEPADVRCPETL